MQPKDNIIVPAKIVARKWKTQMEADNSASKGNALNRKGVVRDWCQGPSKVS